MRALAHLLLCLVLSPAIIAFNTSGASALSLDGAVRIAVDKSPEVLEAMANSRAVGEELNQARSLYRPNVNIESFIGPEFVDQPNSLSVDENEEWRNSRQVSGVARWTLFNGFFRGNEMFRQATRLEGSGYRILEAGELVALDTVEAYVDVLRHKRILQASDLNIAQHRQILSLARSQFDGGAATRGEVELALERLSAAEAVRAEVLRALGEVEARFERLVGQKPILLRSAPFPRSTPRTLEDALAVARASHPTLEAAFLEVEALEATVEQQTASALPEVSIEGRGSHGFDIGGTAGKDNELSLRLVMTWALYDGGLRNAQRREQIQRVGEAKRRLDRFRLDIEETTRRTWSGIVTNDERLAALRRQLTQSERVLAAYYEEYEAGVRSLLDILDAQNARFNAEFEVASAESIAIFSRYQLIGSTGQLLDYFGIEQTLPEIEFRDENLRIYRTGGGLLEPLRR